MEYVTNEIYRFSRSGSNHPNLKTEVCPLFDFLYSSILHLFIFNFLSFIRLNFFSIPFRFLQYVSFFTFFLLIYVLLILFSLYHVNHLWIFSFSFRPFSLISAINTNQCDLNSLKRIVTQNTNSFKTTKGNEISAQSQDLFAENVTSKISGSVLLKQQNKLGCNRRIYSSSYLCSIESKIILRVARHNITTQHWFHLPTHCSLYFSLRLFHVYFIFLQYIFFSHLVTGTRNVVSPMCKISLTL